MVQSTPPKETPLNGPLSPPFITPFQTYAGSTTPFAAPSLEGWPPASQLPVPPPIRDVVMTDNVTEECETPFPSGTTTGPSTDLNTAPARTNTPSRTTNVTETNSRATSQHPDPVAAIPVEAPPHGAPTRRYLNDNVTGVLLDGMKMIAKDRPPNPLKALGEYLVERSKEINRT